MGTSFVGYTRVSTLAQNPELQLDALKASGCGKLFVEKALGAKEDDAQTELSSMTTTRLFKSNRSQALRLPREVAFPESVKEVTIIRDGARRVIAPADARWDDFFESPGIELTDRMQLEAQKREPL